MEAAHVKLLLSRWAEALGVAGTAGIGLAVFCAAFYLGTIRPGEQRLADLRVEKTRLDRIQAQRAREGGAAGGGTVEERLQGFYNLLANEQLIGELLETIDATARRNGVVLRQGSYRFSWEPGSRSGRYEITYAGQTPYHQARIFLHEVLRDLPMLALDEVSFQRQQATAGATELTARFSILVRRES
ncbi:MAG: hypothetical protein HYY78_08850 [Betaproteobacteria bacterium]|nr:hypothetical protein [Betaproteobacteria bacterium]